MVSNPLLLPATQQPLRTVVGWTPQSDAAIDAVGSDVRGRAGAYLRLSVRPQLTRALQLRERLRCTRLPQKRVYPKLGHERINQF